MSTTTVNIDAKMVKELRDKTGAPFGDCKNALVGSNGDIEQAIILLRKKGIAMAGKKASRSTNEGSVSSYIHAGGKIGRASCRERVKISVEGDIGKKKKK